MNGSTGALSLISSVGIWGGASVRVFTSMMDVGDKMILWGYVASACLNGVVAAQVIWYRYVKPGLVRKARMDKAGEEKKRDKEL